MSCVADKVVLIAKGAVYSALLGAAASAHAFEFVSVANPAILYDAPSLKAHKLFVVTRYFPLEQIVTLDNWVKVRDSAGKLYWIEKRALSSKRFVTVSLPVAAVRTGADEDSPVIFQAPQQLVLELLGATGNGWLQVRHLDGTTGYVKANEVWGD